MMHIGIYFDRFDESEHAEKDPGLLATGLTEIGHQVTVVRNGPCIAPSTRFTFSNLATSAVSSPRTWKALGLDIVVAYLWLGRSGVDVARALYAARIPWLLKADSDGRVDARRFPALVLRRQCFESGIWGVGKFVAQAMVSEPWREPLREKLRLASRVVFELEDAVTNLATPLGFPPEKCVVIANPVSLHFTSAPLPPRGSNLSIAMVGRWAAPEKHIALAKRVVSLVGRHDPTLKFFVAGSGGSLWEGLGGNVAILGHVDKSELVNVYSRTTVLLSTSRWESYALAAAESLCMGNSVVGPPLPSFHFLSSANSGTVAQSHRARHLADALQKELENWRAGRRDRHAISAHWRKISDYRLVACQYDSLMRDVLGG